MSHFKFSIDHFDQERLVGWVDNAGPVSPLSLFINGRLVGDFSATRYSADLEVAGFGDGQRGFEIPIRQYLQSGLNRLVLKGQGRDILDENLSFDSLRFSIDCVDQNGLTGWVDVSGPASPLSLYLNDAFIGEFQASSYRADLEDAGIGDGQRGFHIPLSNRLKLGLNRVILKWRDQLLLDDYLFRGTWRELNDALPFDSQAPACGAPNAFVTPTNGQEFVGPNFTVVACLDGIETGAVCRVFSLKEYVESKPGRRHVLSETLLQSCTGDKGAWSGQIGHLRTNQSLVFELSTTDERVLAGALAQTVPSPKRIVRLERPDLQLTFGEIIPPQDYEPKIRYGFQGEAGAWI
ncbi:MAG: hypothetical protein JW395_0536 [Nitrospira sp.]|nr:hypothetical protein [Nitrospira sp.]